MAAPFRQMYEGYQPGQPLPALPDYVPPRESPEDNKELAEKYPVFIEDKPFKGFKAFTPNSVLNNVINLEKI